MGMLSIANALLSVVHADHHPVTGIDNS